MPLVWKIVVGIVAFVSVILVWVTTQFNTKGNDEVSQMVTLAKSSAENNDIPSAMNYFDQALKIAQGKEDQNAQMMVFLEKGYVNESIKNFDEAQKNFERAKGLAHDIGNTTYEKTLGADIEGLDVIREQEKEKEVQKENEQKLKTLQDSLPIIQELKNTEREWDVRMQIFDLQMQLQKYQDADTTIKEARNLVQMTGDAEKKKMIEKKALQVQLFLKK